MIFEEVKTKVQTGYVVFTVINERGDIYLPNLSLLKIILSENILSAECYAVLYPLLGHFKC